MADEALPCERGHGARAVHAIGFAQQAERPGEHARFVLTAAAVVVTTVAVIAVVVLAASDSFSVRDAPVGTAAAGGSRHDEPERHVRKAHDQQRHGRAEESHICAGEEIRDAGRQMIC